MSITASHGRCLTPADVVCQSVEWINIQAHTDIKSWKEKASVILVFVDLSAAMLLSRNGYTVCRVRGWELWRRFALYLTQQDYPADYDKNAKRALRQKAQSFAVQNGVLLHKIGDNLCRVVVINRALSYIYVSELKVAAFSCLIDGLVVPIWPYQFSNAVQSDGRSEHVLIISSSSLFISGNTAHSQEKTRKVDKNRQNTKRGCGKNSLPKCV